MQTSIQTFEYICLVVLASVELPLNILLPVVYLWRFLKSLSF